MGADCQQLDNWDDIICIPLMAALDPPTSLLDPNSVSADPWFARLAPDRQHCLLSRAASRILPAGTRIYRLGDPPNGLHCLLKGEVRLVNYPEPGMETLSNLIRPGQWFGELSSIDGLGRPHDAIISESSVLLTISTQDIRKLLDEDPLWWRDLALLAAMHQRHGMREFIRMRGRTSFQRLAGFLANKAITSNSRTIRLSQSELAQLIGISRQQMNVLLGRLQQAGYVTAQYRKLQIRDLDALRSLSKHG